MPASFLRTDHLSEVTGVVISVNPASCDIQLNEKRTQIGRLYKRDSRAFQAKQPFDQLPEYQPGTQVTGLINGKKQLKDQTLYYLQERWVDNNPWINLTLRPGDEVTGRVSDAVPDFTGKCSR